MKTSKNNQFYISWIKFSICLYILHFFKYVFFIIRIYIDDNVFFLKWTFLYDNLKETLSICIPVFIIHFFLHKYGSGKYRE